MSVSFGIYLGSSSCCIAVNKVLETDIVFLHDLWLFAPLWQPEKAFVGRIHVPFLVCCVAGI